MNQIRANIESSTFTLTKFLKFMSLYTSYLYDSLPRLRGRARELSGAREGVGFALSLTHSIYNHNLKANPNAQTTGF